MADSTSRLNESFSYTTEQTRRIQDALKRAGASDETDWPRLLSEITRLGRTAIQQAQAEPAPYAGQAATQIVHVANTLNALASSFEALGFNQQAAILSQHAITLEEEPLLLRSLLAGERTALNKLLQSDRFIMLLRIVARSAERVVAQLEAAGQAVPLSAPLPTTVSAMSADEWKMVQEAVHKAVGKKRQPFGNRFPATGTPKEAAVRLAIPRLWHLFETVTGHVPTVYPHAYDKVGYGGAFYAFAEAVLAPLRVIDRQKLGRTIRTAYDAHRRQLLSEPPIPRRHRKTKTPRQ